MYNDHDDLESPDLFDTHFMPAWRFITNFVQKKAPDFNLDQVPDPVATFMMEHKLGVGPYKPENNNQLLELAGSTDRIWFKKKRKRKTASQS